MTKRYNPKEKVFYYIFEKKGIFTSYRDLAEILGFPVGTLHRVVKELEEEGKIKTTADENYTHFELVGSTEKTTIFDFAISSDPVTFTSRQHRIIDYLKLEFIKNQDRFVGKMEVLYKLRKLFFTEYEIDIMFIRKSTYNARFQGESEKMLSGLEYFNEIVGSRRYDMKEYADLTKDVQFINEHCDVRQVLIISRAGKGGGIKIARKSEAADYLRREQINILKRYDRYHIKRKFLEKDGNFRFVFEEDSKAKKYLEITK